MRNEISSVSGVLSRGKRAFVLGCAACALVADFVTLLLLWVRGSAFLYVLFPLLYTLADALFLFGVIKTNFRFKYALAEVGIYILANILLTTLMHAAAMSGAAQVFTQSAIAYALSLRGALAAATAAAYVYCACLIKGGRVVQTVVVSVLAAFFGVLSVSFTVNLFTGGYFGQGGLDERGLVYELDGDGYKVTGVMQGREKRIRVPAYFEGKPVKEVTCAVFSSGADTVVLDCDADVTFNDIYCLEYCSDKLQILCGKDDTDKFRKVFYEFRSGWEPSFDAANRIVPHMLPDDEIYVTFSYDAQAYKIAGGDVLETYFGKRGQPFSFDGYNLSYVQSRDKRDEEQLYARYTANKYIMNEPLVGDKPLSGQTLEKSVAGVDITFDRVCAVTFGDDNDDIYAASESDTKSYVNGGYLDKKLTSLEYADEVLENFTRRDGFALSWQYAYGSENVAFRSLKDELKGRADGEITVFPYWMLEEHALQTSQSNVTVRYGDNAGFSATVPSLAGGLRAEYLWTCDGQTVGEESTLTLSSVPYRDAQYGVTVTIAAPEITSLSETLTASFYLRVTPRAVRAIWTDPQERTYCARELETGCALADADIVAGDDISLLQTSFTYTNAGRHSFTAGLAGADAYKYTLSGGTHTVTLAKAELTLSWGAGAFVYDGKSHAPTAEIASGLYVGDVAQIRVAGNINAGQHTARAEFTQAAYGTNYAIANPTSTYVIEKATVQVVWSDGGDGTFTYEYDGKSHAPTAKAYGVDGSELTLSVSGGSSQSGRHTARATLSGAAAGNYTLSGDTVTFTVKEPPKPVEPEKKTGVEYAVR